MTYRSTDKTHEVEYVKTGRWSQDAKKDAVLTWIFYRYRGKLYRVTATTWQRDYVAVEKRK